jgi:hypothetical protein
MNIGMLWFDNDPKSSLDLKIERAARYYQVKYGKSPTLCFVHPSMLKNGSFHKSSPENGEGGSDAEKNFAACGIEIRLNQSVLPNHFWIGVNGVSQGRIIFREESGDGGINPLISAKPEPIRKFA